MYKFLFGTVIIFISILGVAQEIPTKNKKISPRKQIKLLAKEQIGQLKKGALLIRLHTKKQAIEELKKIGKNDLANKLENKQFKYNLSIVSAFKKHFKFCSTYFFFSNYSNFVREKQFDKVVFLNDSLLLDTSIKFHNSFFLTAEFGSIEQDTTKYYSHSSYEVVSDWDIERKDHYYGSPAMRFDALIIKNDEFFQLRKPFPYYARTFETIPIERSVKNTVIRMNIKFILFYNRVSK